MTDWHRIQYLKDSFKVFIRMRLQQVNPQEQIFWMLDAHGNGLRNINALEVFGMHGLWTAVWYLSKCQHLDLWEIDRAYADFARRLGSNVNVTVGDSVNAANKNDSRLGKYNFIMLDNPLGGVYGQAYYKNFNLFPGIFRYPSGPREYVIVLNCRAGISHSDLSCYGQWRGVRGDFYGIDSEHIFPDVGVGAYRELAQSCGFRLLDSFYIPHIAKIGFLAQLLERS